MSGHEKKIRFEMMKLSRKLRAAAEEALSYEPTALQKHANLMRDLSGLCRKGILRLAWTSLERQVDQATLDRLKDLPQVEHFLKLAKELPLDKLENLARLILQEMDVVDPHPLKPETNEGEITPRFGKRARSRSPEYVTVEVEPGSRRPVTPSRSPPPVRREQATASRPLPPPPFPEWGGFNWNRPWTKIASALTRFDKNQLWLVCPCEGCNKWFKQPSAFKQHLAHKQGQGDHCTEEQFAEFNFNLLWDSTWNEMEKIERTRRDKAASVEEPTEKSGQRKRTFDEAMVEWPAEVPRPPKPVHDVEFKRKLNDEGWNDPVPAAVVELMSMEEHLRATKKALEPEHWYEYITPIGDEISKEMVAGLSKSAWVHLEQVKNLDPLEFDLYPGWGPDDILAYVTSRLRQDFNSLGVKWMLTYKGSHVARSKQWLHFGVIFSPGISPEGQPLGKVVGIEALPGEVQDLLKYPGPIALKEGVVDALARVDDSKVRAVSSSHGTPAANNEYHDEIVEDLLAAAVQAEYDLKSRAEAMSPSAVEALLPPVDSTTGLVEPMNVEGATNEQENTGLMLTGGIAGHTVGGPEENEKAKSPAPRGKEEEEELRNAPVEATSVGATALDSAATPEVKVEGDGLEAPHEEPVLSPTVPFTVTAESGAVSSSLFEGAPAQTGYSVTRSDQGWSRPPREGYKGARIFVDGRVQGSGETVSSGILGPIGFAFMCIGCGKCSNSFELSWGYPVCAECRDCIQNAAQARAQWRTQAAFITPLEEGSCFGNVSGSKRVGDEKDCDPRVIVARVLEEFRIVPVDHCALRMNVWIRVEEVFHSLGRTCFTARSVDHETTATIAMDDWFVGRWIPSVGDVLWISGLSTWGAIGDRVVQFLFSPIMGIGIAKQPGPAGHRFEARALELFAGIGGWRTACENVLGIEQCFSIDVDPKPCKLLGLQKGIVPVTVDQILENTICDESQVVIGNVADPRWWFTTCLNNPFDVMLWSSPCISFSLAGLKAGLASPEGEVMLKAIGLRVVFGVPLSFGENVMGLTGHAHWPLIEEFARVFGSWTWVNLNLCTITTMQRPRIFIVQANYGNDILDKMIKEYVSKVVQDIVIAPTVIDPAEAALLRISRDTLRMLADPELLVHHRVVSKEDRDEYGYGIAERVFQWPGDILPTLMANHGRQHLLPRRLLQQNGLLSWVVADLNIGNGVQSLRTLHPFEALWLLGFDVFCPVFANQDTTMKPIGNTVSPWIAGIFIAAVFATIGDARFILKGQRWLKSCIDVDRLIGMRVFTRGDCHWIGRGIPLRGTKRGCCTGDMQFSWCVPT